MVKQLYQQGNSGDYAEILIDYKNKKVDIRNPKTQKPFETKKGDEVYGVASTFFLVIPFTCVISSLFFSFFILYYSYNKYVFILINIMALLSVILIIHFIIAIFSNKYQNYLHRISQWILVDLFQKKSIVTVIPTKLKSKNGQVIWKLPYRFLNEGINVKYSGDFKEFREKLHIFPKNHNPKNTTWECLIYFSQEPKRGKMIIEYI